MTMSSAQYTPLLLGIMMFVIAIGEDPCKPHCMPSTPKVIDPHDCSQYYYCNPDLTPNDTPEKCRNGLYFNPSSMECDTGACHLICGRCHLTCDKTLSFDIIADVSDCSVFYECNNEIPGDAHICPTESPHFDGTTKTCVNNATACCNPGCNPHCEPGMLFAPDPTNCKKYYECISGIPSIQHICLEDEVYDIGSALCKVGAKCTEWCNSGGGGEISTTTITTTPTTTTSSSECITSFLCMEAGFFPMCSYCHPGYFYCPGPGYAAYPEFCSDGMDFNPVPDNYFCVKSESCPYFSFQ